MVTHVNFHISDCLTTNEWKILGKFCEKCKRLAATKLAREEGGGLRGQIKFTPTEGLNFYGNIPPEEQIVEFLTAFRFFYLQKEPTHFPKVLNIIGKYTNHSDGKMTLKVLNNQWKNSLFGSALNISYNNVPITSSLLLDLWFNAHYFHSDESKASDLEKMREGLTENFLKYMLLDAVYEATKVVFKLYVELRSLVGQRLKSNSEKELS